MKAGTDDDGIEAFALVTVHQVFPVHAAMIREAAAWFKGSAVGSLDDADAAFALTAPGGPGRHRQGEDVLDGLLVREERPSPFSSSLRSTG